MISGILKAMRTIDDITTLDVSEILPHRPPFILIDRLIHYDNHTTCVKTSYTVPACGIMLEDGHLSTGGLIENIAQSCAARIGFYDWLHEIPVKAGVIGSIKGFKAFSHPESGQTIITSITPKAEALGVLMADAQVFLETGELVAECTLKVAV